MKPEIKLISIFLTSCLLAPLAGCGGGSGANADSPQTHTFLQSSLQRDASPVVTTQELSAVAEGNAAFALKIFGSLGNANTNTAFSPYSVTMAVAMAAAGAKGNTLSGIEQAMSFPLPQGSFNPALNKLDLLLASKTNGDLLPGGLQRPQLNMANDLWGQQGYSFLSSYLDALAINFGAGMHEVDFAGATEQARVTINNWVDGKTNGRIKDLLPLNSLSSDTRLVLTNALWFKANWESKFAISETATQTFFNRDGSQASVPLMHKSLYLPYAGGNGFQAIDIPYVEGKLSMLVVMPDAGTFDTFVSALTPAGLNDIAGTLTNQYINLGLPKFTFESENNMTVLLQAAGMTDAFDPAKADFSGIDGTYGLSISGVRHKAFIAIDEEGTEAAAATAIAIGTSSIPPPVITLTVDHPFLFFIRDRETGLILVMGKVVKL